VSPRARLGIDAAALIIALGASEWSGAGDVGRSSSVWLFGFLLLTLAILRARGAYRHRLRVQILDEIRSIVLTTSLAAMTILALRVLLTNDPSSAGQTARHWVFATALLAATHAFVGSAEIRARRRGEVGRSTLIVGAGKVGHLVARRMLLYPELGLRPVGFLDEAPLLENGDAPPVPILGGTAELEEAIARFGVDHVVITFSTASHGVLLGVVSRCEKLGVSVSFVPRLFEKMKDKVRVESMGSLPLLSVDPTDTKGWQFEVKYVLDRIFGAALLTLASPLFLLGALAVWISSGRPILYRQLRVGRDGRLFEMLKFRSMKPEDEEEAALTPLELPADTAPGGAEASYRRTRVGAFMRRTSLDEIPQLINVLRGEMSLVGPRPERPEFVELFEQNVHRYADRHRVKAGITGWAQINGLRGNTSLNDRAEWDNYYIDNWSLWLDFKILLSTATALVRFPAD
jgi:exopolysaccharide biosynthesis polyprenyl glycosylphosphotransferase